MVHAIIPMIKLGCESSRHSESDVGGLHENPSAEAYGCVGIHSFLILDSVPKVEYRAPRCLAITKSASDKFFISASGKCLPFTLAILSQ